MSPNDPMRMGTLLACVGLGAFFARCVVFNGKTSTQSDEAVDSGAGDSEPETASPPDPGIRCGTNDWCSPGAVCCRKLGASGWFSPSPPCSAPGTCDNFSEFACDTARNCEDGGAPTGDSCCATRESATTEFRGSKCVFLGACSPTALAVLLCTPADRTPCPDHQSCVGADAGELPPGYSACQ
jgi:hypothetical protein